MHERAVCHEIMDICLQARNDYQLRSIESITLRVGIHSCINKGQLEYLFQIAKQDTFFENTQLLFIDEDYQVQCLNCGHIYSPQLEQPICEKCQSSHYQVISGYDCFVDHIDGQN